MTVEHATTGCPGQTNRAEIPRFARDDEGWAYGIVPPRRGDAVRRPRSGANSTEGDAARRPYGMRIPPLLARFGGGEGDDHEVVAGGS